MGNMTTRHFGAALFLVCLALLVAVPACEYDPNTGGRGAPTYTDVLPSPEAGIAEVIV